MFTNSNANFEAGSSGREARQSANNSLRAVRAARRIRDGIRYVLGARPAIRITNLDYDQYWRARGMHGVVDRFPIIATFLQPGESLLDIGCGEGTGLEYLQRAARIVGRGVDISPVAIDMARARGLNVEVGDVTAADFEVDGLYDTVLISEVLEHIAEPERVIRLVSTHVRTRLILTFPSIGYLPHRLRMLFGRFPVQWGWHPGEHLRFWTLSDYEWWLDQLDYDIQAVQASNGVRGLSHLWPSLFGNQIVVVARPRDQG